jgi:hypothetical protein
VKRRRFDFGIRGAQPPSIPDSWSATAFDFGIHGAQTPALMDSGITQRRQARMKIARQELPGKLPAGLCARSKIKSRKGTDEILPDL